MGLFWFLSAVTDFCCTDPIATDHEEARVTRVSEGHDSGYACGEELDTTWK